MRPAYLGRLFLEDQLWLRLINCCDGQDKPRLRLSGLAKKLSASTGFVSGGRQSRHRSAASTDLEWQ